LTVLFSDGFENGFAEWSAVNQAGTRVISVQSNIKHHGNYAASFYMPANAPSGEARVRKTLNSELSEWYFRGYVYFENFALNDGVAKRIMGADNFNRQATGVFLGLINDGGVYKWCVAVRGDNNWTYINLETPLPETGKWYCVELYVKISATEGKASLWIDGNLVVEATGLNNLDRGNAYYFDVGFDFWDAGTTFDNMTVYWDCTAIGDTYIGPEAPVLPKLTVQASPEINVPVYVDEVFVGNTPVTVTLESGTHTVRVEREVVR
jgi:hypothetical protein